MIAYPIAHRSPTRSGSVSPSYRLGIPRTRTRTQYNSPWSVGSVVQTKSKVTVTSREPAFGFGDQR